MPEITLSLTQAKYDKFKIGYLELYPVPKDEENNPLMSEGEWIKKTLIDMVHRDYNRGMMVIYDKGQPVKEENLIT